jgi:5-methylcytosine-specific restriction endonuclease McrA
VPSNGDGPRRAADFLVLLLNQNYEPLNVCPARRALVLLDKGKAELLENGVGYIRTATIILELPSVIRLMYHVRRPLPLRRLTRRELFQRDRFQCQYCGLKTRELTLDHVMPRVRGGRHEWENVVTACKTCNHRTAGRTPAEAGMRLTISPGPPPTSPYYPVLPYLDQRREWRKFLPSSLVEGL